MDKRQLIERKRTWSDIIDVGLFWVPDQNEYVTWQINRQFEGESEDFGCINGHYFSQHSFDEAVEDYNRR